MTSELVGLSFFLRQGEELEEKVPNFVGLGILAFDRDLLVDSISQVDLLAL